MQTTGSLYEYWLVRHFFFLLNVITTYTGVCKATLEVGQMAVQCFDYLVKLRLLLISMPWKQQNNHFECLDLNDLEATFGKDKKWQLNNETWLNERFTDGLIRSNNGCQNQLALATQVKPIR